MKSQDSKTFIKVHDHIEVKKNGEIGIVVLLFGYPPRELYADIGPPGADAGYEYITMFDEDLGKVELRALNRYAVKDVKVIKKSEYNKKVRAYWKQPFFVEKEKRLVNPRHPCKNCGKPLRAMPWGYRGRGTKCKYCGFQDMRK